MILKKIFFPVLILSALLFSCKQNDNTTKTTIPENANDSIKKQAIVLDTFSFNELPDAPLKECFCNFSVDSIAHQQHSTIFVYDLSTIAFTKINGKIIKFTQTEYSTTGTTFKSENYDLILVTTVAKAIGKEITQQSGTIQVRDKKGNATIISYYGECGCSK